MLFGCVLVGPERFVIYLTLPGRSLTINGYGGRWMKRPGVRLFWVFVALVATGSEPAARADSVRQPTLSGSNNIEAAKAAYEKGRRHYNVGQFFEAAGAFAESYQQSGNPTLLFNVGQAYRLAGQPEQAARAYKAFLREAPDDPNRSFAEAKLHEVNAAAATGAPTLVSHNPSDKMLSRQGTWDTEVAQKARPAATRTIPRWATWTGAGVTAVLATGAVISGVSGNAKYNGLQEGCGQTEQGCSDRDVNDLASRARLTNLLWIAAAVVGVSTAVMFTIDHSRESTTVSMAMRF